MIESQRHLFDVPDDVAYFNCAYYSPQLNASRERLLLGVQEKSHPWTRTPSTFFDDAERIRVLAAGLFGGDTEGYAIVPAASYGLSAAARAIEPTLRAGDEIMVAAEEFPSNVLPWQRVARESGATVITVATPESKDWTGAILERMRPSVKVLATSPCHWTNGARIDLVALAHACRSTGCALVIDATQMLGAVPIPLDEIQPDFLVASGYKWLLGPYGFALQYVGPQWRDARPLEETWLARRNAEDFSGLVKYADEYQPGARRFDVGEKCTPTILPGAIAALEQLQRWGIGHIADTLSVINNRIADHLEQLGFRMPPKVHRCAHMFGAELPKGAAENVIDVLKARNIFVSRRGQSLRFAPHVHVTDHDVTRLLDAMTDIVTRRA